MLLAAFGRERGERGKGEVGLLLLLLLVAGVGATTAQLLAAGASVGRGCGLTGYAQTRVLGAALAFGDERVGGDGALVGARRVELGGS